MQRLRWTAPHVLAKYTQPSDTWQVETIATDPNAFGGIGLAVEGNGVPHVVFSSSTGLRHAVKVAAAWSVADVPGVASSREPVLALDALANAHIVFVGASELRYATDAGGAWSTESIEPANAAGWHDVAMALDQGNAAHVSYLDATTRNLKYATNKSGAWVAMVVDPPYGAGFGSAIAIDASGAAHISYVHSGRLKYVTNPGGAWHNFDLDFSGGGNTSIAIDSIGRIHIVYYSGSSLWLATLP